MCEMLGVDVEQMRKWLCNRKFITANEVLVKPLTKSQVNNKNNNNNETNDSNNNNDNNNYNNSNNNKNNNNNEFTSGMKCLFNL